MRDVQDPLDFIPLFGSELETLFGGVDETGGEAGEGDCCGIGITAMVDHVSVTICADSEFVTDEG